MLFLAQNGFLSVVQETRFKNVLTLQTNDPQALEPFEELTPAKVMVNYRDVRFPYVLQVSKLEVASVLGTSQVLFGFETVTNPVSASAQMFLIQGIDRNYVEPMQIYARPEELPGLIRSRDYLENLSVYPLYVLTDEMKSSWT